MKKPRLLTPEERRLWRESNRLTTPWVDSDIPPEAETMPVEEGAATTYTPRAWTPMVKRTARAQAPLQTLAPREAPKRFKPYGAAEATLDLHGLTKLDAYARVQHFIAHQHRLGHRHVAIITGKGRSGEAGVLRSALPEWLNEPALRPRISGFAHARPEKGGTGVMHVLLKRPA